MVTYRTLPTAAACPAVELRLALPVLTQSGTGAGRALPGSRRSADTARFGEGRSLPTAGRPQPTIMPSIVTTESTPTVHLFATTVAVVNDVDVKASRPRGCPG